MLYLDFRKKLSPYIVFSVAEIKKIWPSFNNMNLLHWQRKGYLVKIRNGWYMFAETPLNEYILYKIANKVYSPSYISMESALHYHGVIPEGVFSYHSVTTLKTNSFDTSVGRFHYATLKPACFFGYELVSKGNYVFKIACIEKAILDFLYLKPSVKTIADLEAMRFNPLILHEMVNEQVLDTYTPLFASKTLDEKIKKLKQYYQ